MISYLEIHNFKQHRLLSLDLSEGSTAIVGDNYTGKSSILYAILVALYGVSAVPGGSAAAWSWDTEDTSWIDLHFSIGVDHYELQRTKSSAVLVTAGGSEIARGTTAVNNAVIDLLGADRKTYQAIKYSEQEETYSLLTLGATGLNTLIERVSGIDQVSEWLGAISALRVRYQAMLEVTAETDVEALQAELSVADGQQKEMRLSAARIAEDLSSTEIQLGVAESWSARLQAMDTRYEAAHARALELQEEIGHKDESIAAVKLSLRALGDDHPPPEELRARRQALANDREAWAAHATYFDEWTEGNLTLSQYKDSLPEAEAAEAEAMANSRAARAVVESMPTSLADNNQQLTAVGIDIARLKAQIEDGVCSACRRPLDDTFDPIAASDELSAKIAESNKLDRYRAALIKARDELDDATDTWVQAADLLSLRGRLIKAVTAKLDEAVDPGQPKKGLSQIEAELLDLDQLEEQAHSWIRRQAELDSLTTGLAELRQKLLDVPYDGAKVPTAELEESEAEVITLKEQLGIERTALEAAQEDSIRAEGRVENLTAELAEGAENNRKRAAATGKLDQLKRLRKYLTDHREAFLGQVWGQILATTSTFCSHATGGDLTGVTRHDSAFYFTRGDNPTPRPVVAASGCQKSVMGVAMKLALAQWLPDALGCLLLDEVTANMDEAHSSAVMQLLDATGHQILTVTHSDADLAGVEQVIRLPLYS